MYLANVKKIQDILDHEDDVSFVIGYDNIAQCWYCQLFKVDVGFYEFTSTEVEGSEEWFNDVTQACYNFIV